MLGFKLIKDKGLPVIHNLQNFIFAKLFGPNHESTTNINNKAQYKPAFEEDIEIEIGCSVRAQTINEEEQKAEKYGGI